MGEPISSTDSSLDKPDYQWGDEMRCGDCGQPSISAVNVDPIGRCKNPECRRNKVKPAA